MQGEGCLSSNFDGWCSLAPMVTETITSRQNPTLQLLQLNANQSDPRALDWRTREGLDAVLYGYRKPDFQSNQKLQIQLLS